MTLSFESNSLAVKAGHYACLIEMPQLVVGEGVLGDRTCLECRACDTDDSVTVTLRWKVGDRDYSGSLAVKRHAAGITWRTEAAPCDGQAWTLRRTNEICAVLSGWRDVERVKLFHADNIRGVSQCSALLEGTYYIPISRWKRPLNAGRWQSFPGLWLTETGGRTGFICGVLSQDVWKHTILGKCAGSSLELTGEMTSPGIDVKQFGTGEAYRGETLYMEWVEAEAPEQAFAGYLHALSDRLVPAKSRSSLSRSTSWGSWNDRQPCFWDVSEELVLRTAEVLTTRFPSVSALQLDDGYADGGFYEVVADHWTKLEHGLNPEDDAIIQRPRRLGAAFLYEKDYAIALDRFPQGLQATRHKITRAGFVSGIWLGLNLVYDAKLAAEHPDWMIEARSWANTDPELLTVFGKPSREGFRVLDPSHPEVQNYFRSLVEMLFEQWGFEALKLDFWSYAFENDCFRFQHTDKTAYELRSWFFSLFRSRVSTKSYFTTACDIITGNPFLSTWVDNVRYGIDIGNGRWENIKYTAFTGTFLLHVEAYRFYLLNSDSIGVLGNLPENERAVFWSWAAVTRSTCEIAGDLAMQSREKLRPLQKLLLSPKNGEAAFIEGTSHLLENEPAGIVWSKGDMFSAAGDVGLLPDAILALFNWQDVPRSFTVDAGRLGALDGQVADVEFFTDACNLRSQTTWEITLPSRSSRLCHLSFLRRDRPRILASNWQVRSVFWQDDALDMSLLGDSTKGLLLHWPFSQAPRIESNVPYRMSRHHSLLKITPILALDELHNWQLKAVSEETRLQLSR